MSQLFKENCINLDESSQLCTADEVKLFLGDLDSWSIVFDGMEKLERVFRFNTFAEALKFTNQIANEAEQQGHHPKLTTEWGKVTVSWWTHFLGGLHKNDFIMAARTDSLY
tara:strand:- start:4261 stop:4593 length:333 start_codon:yes stop_codon:yes gene_type:complete